MSSILAAFPPKRAALSNQLLRCHAMETRHIIAYTLIALILASFTAFYLYCTRESRGDARDDRRRRKRRRARKAEEQLARETAE
jgi:hypothetical protein